MEFHYPSFMNYLKIITGLLALLFSSTSAFAQTKITDVLLAGQSCNNQICGSAGVPGQMVGEFVIIGPTAFSGSLQLIGQNQGFFTIRGTQLFVGPNGLPAGSYPITLKVSK